MAAKTSSDGERDEAAAEGTGDGSSGDPSRSSAQERRLLQHGRSSLLRAAGPSLTIKHGSLFLLCSHDGDIDTEIHGSYGLYFHDTRFLSRMVMRLNGERFSVLLSTDRDGVEATCELTNPELEAGDRVISKEAIGVRRSLRITDCVEEKLTVTNFSSEDVELGLEMEFGADFENMFVVRGADEGKRGTLHAPKWDGRELSFVYDGADGRKRSTSVSFEPGPDRQEQGRATYSLKLTSHSSWDLSLTMKVADEGPGSLEASPQLPREQDMPFAGVKIETDNSLFNAVISQAFTDLRMLVSRERGDTYFAAGVPWYVALFGRDSLITALQTLTYDPAIAANTLRVLAAQQGTKHDAWRDEEPGKILHELRVGEKAHLNEVPQTPYYGTVDATPLFIILLAEYVMWTGDTGLWKELKENVDRALKWIDEYGDHDGDGFVDYESGSSKGLTNQGWKDSGNSITNRDGSIVKPPVALVEVQGYVYRAKLAAAGLYEQDGNGERATELREQAKALRENFNRAYWMDDRKYLAVALEAGGKQAQSIASNPGQALWGGIVDEEAAKGVASVLNGESMFNGWGIRTLAEGEAAYNPIDYQVGSVWPHDNSLIGAGLRRYGFDQEFLKVFTGIFDAATHFRHYRLPEVFAGFRRDNYNTPVHYPVACSPQAWASGAIPYLLTSALGLFPAAHENRLHIRRPMLPSWLQNVEVSGLRMGGTTFHIGYQQVDGRTLVALLDRQGDAELSIEY